MSNKTAYVLESVLFVLDIHCATPQISGSRNSIFSLFHCTFSSLPNPLPQFCSLSSPFQIFFQSLSLWQVSRSIARKEADVPNFRYAPDPLAFYLTGIRRFQNRHFLMEQILSNTYLKKKKQGQKNLTYIISYRQRHLKQVWFQEPKKQHDKYCLTERDIRVRCNTEGVKNQFGKGKGEFKGTASKWEGKLLWITQNLPECARGLTPIFIGIMPVERTEG